MALATKVPRRDDLEDARMVMAVDRPAERLSRENRSVPPSVG